jgi:hypothetical protein
VWDGAAKSKKAHPIRVGFLSVRKPKLVNEMNYGTNQTAPVVPTDVADTFLCCRDTDFTEQKLVNCF